MRVFTIIFFAVMLAESYLIGADILCDGGCVNNGFGMLTATKRYDERALSENW